MTFEVSQQVIVALNNDLGKIIFQMCMLGSFFTFLGYLAVIAGSGYRVSNSSNITTVISSVMFNGLIGASGGALTAYGLRRTLAKCYGHHLPLLNVLFGAAAGIVSILFSFFPLHTL